MSTSKPFQAMRRANPRTKPGFAGSVEATRDAVRAQIATEVVDLPEPEPSRRRLVPRGALLRVSVGGLALAGAGLVAFVIFGSSGGAGVPDAGAAVRKAASLTAASAESSGTAVIRVKHNSELRSGSTIRWHDGNLAVSNDGPGPGRPGSAFLVVDGVLYTADADDDGWVVLGAPEKITGDAPTTRDDIAAVRDDIGGANLRRMIDGLTDLTTTKLKDGSTVYRGTLPGSRASRDDAKRTSVLPFDYEAEGETADPSAPLDVAITVGPDGLVREDVVQWGTGGSVWTYAVTYTRLGKTSALPAPTNARLPKDAPTSGSRATTE